MKATRISLILFSLIFLSTNSQFVRFLMTKKEKKSLPPQENFRNLEASSTTGSLHIKNTGNDFPYITTVQIGSHKADLNLVIDTGFPLVWIPDSSLSNTFNNTFECSKSKSCNLKDRTLNLNYNGRTIDGPITNDQVSLGSLTLPKFDVLLAKNVQEFDSSYFDGILGLSLGSYDNSLPTVLDSLKDQGIIKDRMFSMYFGHGDSESENKVPGELIFGGYDSKYAQEDFKYVKIKSEEENIHWLTEVNGIGIGNKEVVSFSTNYPAIFNSAINFLVLPEEIVDKIVDKLVEKGLQENYDENERIHWCKCSAQDTLEDLTFYLDGNSFVVPASSYVKKSEEGCYLALMAVEEADIKVPIILGEVFLKNYYTVFNADEKTVGLAKVNSAFGGEPEICFSCNPWLNFILIFSMFALFCYFIKKSRDVKKQGVSGNGVLIAGNGAVRGRVKNTDNQPFQELANVVNDTSEQDMTNIII